MTAALEGGEWSASRPGRTLHLERPGTHFTGGWVGPMASLDGRKISSPPGFDPGPFSPLAQTLYRLSYRAHSSSSSSFQNFGFVARSGLSITCRSLFSGRPVLLLPAGWLCDSLRVTISHGQRSTCSNVMPGASTVKTVAVGFSATMVESRWNVMAHDDSLEGKWRGNWRMDWVASTLHTTSEHGVSSITTADAHTSAASSQLNWRPRRFKWTLRFRKTKNIFCACAITFQTQSTYSTKCAAPYPRRR